MKSYDDFVIIEIEKGYIIRLYISHIDESATICYLLNIKYYEFVNAMLKEYKGFLISDKTICFKTRENCQKAIDWLESRLLMRKLKEQ